jgi:hypothetical protein
MRTPWPRFFAFLLAAQPACISAGDPDAPSNSERPDDDHDDDDDDDDGRSNASLFQLPPACDGYEHIGPEEQRFTMMQFEYYDGAMVDLETSFSSSACMTSIMRTLADDPPPPGPWSLRIGKSFDRRDWEADGPPTPERAETFAAFHAVADAVKGAGCPVGDRKLRVHLSITKTIGTIGEVRVEPQDDAAACLVAATYAAPPVPNRFARTMNGFFTINWQPPGDPTHPGR